MRNITEILLGWFRPKQVKKLDKPSSDEGTIKRLREWKDSKQDRSRW